MLKKIFSIIFRIAISVILLIFLFRLVDKKSLLAIIKNADKPLLFLAFIVLFFNYLLCLLRWQMLLKAADIRLPLKRVIISFSGGIFFNLFLPSTIGGDLMRSLDLAAHTKKPNEVVATVLLDRLSGYVGLVILALLAIMFGWQFVRDSSVLFIIGIITALLIAILLILFNNFLYVRINKFLDSSGAGKIRESIKNLQQEIYIFRRNKKMILSNLAISFLVQLSSPISFYFIALALGIKIRIIYFLVFLPIIGAITLLPVSIGGLGLRDATTIFFFAKAGVSRDLAFAMSLISFFFILIYGALGGLIYVLTVRHRRLQSHQPSAVSPSA
jgi:uncharacterized protein (TIRG00374 family)